MPESFIFAKLPAVLLPWYQKHKRELPWRSTEDPYRIWLSEIMLQQTRVEAVKSYYERFLKKLPTVDALANADDALLHKLWEGLGYYSRVRNLKKAAQEIVSRYNGVFPAKYDEIRNLPGIGPYTAGAICSIAFNQKTPAVDGNVLRVAARLTDDHTVIDTPAFKNAVNDSLQSVYPEEAGDFTQALMELGATVCKPNGTPDCHICPCKDICLANAHGTADDLPVRQAKRARKVETYTVLIMQWQGRFALQQRSSNGLLAGLWEFPNIPGKLTAQQIVDELENMGVRLKEIKAVVERKHIFTHIQWDMSGVYLDAVEPNGSFKWLTAEQINTQIALPTAFRMFWDAAERV